MYLKKLEVAGFKSFGSRTKLKLDEGVVAVVGPNGSGKSNIADSVRWVLGEQSAKLLRSKKSQELIFNGTETKPKSSMAEVSILLDNTDEKMPIDFREIEITRRIFRSGESDYLLNGNKVRLADIEDILARSGFGQHSYSVIGQGMIDNLIIASPAERKLMFDEASGIRTFELRREANIKKLEIIKNNLVRTDDIIRELTPRTQLLASQASKLSRQAELINKLDTSRKSYLASSFRSLSQQIAKHEVEKLRLKKSEQEVIDRLSQIHDLQKNEKQNQSKRNGQFAIHTRQLKKAETDRDQYFNSLVIAQAELKVVKESNNTESDKENELKTVDAEHKAASRSLTLIKKRHTSLSQSVSSIEAQIKKYDDRLAELTSQLTQCRHKVNKGQKREYLQHALGLTMMLGKNQKKPTLKPAQINIVLHKLARMIKLATEDKTEELMAEISRLQNMIAKVMVRREEVSERQTEEVLKLRSLELDINAIESQIESLDERQRQLIQTNPKHETITKTILQRTKLIDSLQVKVDDLDVKITELREKIYIENKTQQTTSSVNIEQSKLAEKLAGEQASLQAKIKSISDQIKNINFELKTLKIQCQKWFGNYVKIEDLPPSHEPVNIELITKLEAEIEAIGQLDQGITKEATDEQARLQFLTEQSSDLTSAIADLEKIIRGLEGLINEKFEQAFARINLKFNQYFIQLFGGGKASILLKKDSLGLYGIEIKASPPGKKVELLTSLSGGERALAGMALLAGIMSVNPSPFVILDEVDAALDDVNSLKFARILKQLSLKSQIIVITHNHETMKIAHQLFGVTTDQVGDSMLFSVKLEQAHEMSEV